jgi:hypothetical protein
MSIIMYSAGSAASEIGWNVVRYLIVLLIVLGGFVALEFGVGASFGGSALLAVAGAVVVVGLPLGLVTAAAISSAARRLASPWARVATVAIATVIPLLVMAALGVLVPDGGPGAGSDYQGPYPVYAVFLALAGFV